MIALFALKEIMKKYDFCMELPVGLMIKPISKHKG